MTLKTKPSHAKEMMEQLETVNYADVEYAKKVIDLIEIEMKKGRCIEDCWRECYKKAQIPQHINYMGKLTLFIINYWEHGEEYKEAYCKKHPNISKYIGLI